MGGNWWLRGLGKEKEEGSLLVGNREVAGGRWKDRQGAGE